MLLLMRRYTKKCLVRLQFRIVVAPGTLHCDLYLLGDCFKNQDINPFLNHGTFDIHSPQKTGFFTSFYASLTVEIEALTTEVIAGTLFNKVMLPSRFTKVRTSGLLNFVITCHYTFGFQNLNHNSNLVFGSCH